MLWFGLHQPSPRTLPAVPANEAAWLVLASGKEPWPGQVDLGFACGVGVHRQLDLGCNFGVAKSAPDFQPFLGLRWRY